MRWSVDWQRSQQSFTCHPHCSYCLPNNPLPTHGKKYPPRNWSLVPKRMGTFDLEWASLRLRFVWNVVKSSSCLCRSFTYTKHSNMNIRWHVLFIIIPRWFSGEESSCLCRRHHSQGFDPWVGKIPWRRSWQPTPVSLPGESQGPRSLVGYSPWGCKELDRTEHALTLILSLEDANSLSEPSTLTARLQCEHQLSLSGQAGRNVFRWRCRDSLLDLVDLFLNICGAETGESVL